MVRRLALVSLLAVGLTFLAGCGGARPQGAVPPGEEKGYRYVSAAQLRNDLLARKPMHIVDIRVPEEFKEGHIPGSLATFAYPVKSEAEQAKLDAVLPVLRQDANPVIIVCPRGAGGAERTYQYLRQKGIAESRLYILEKGWEGWRYDDLTEKGLPGGTGAAEPGVSRERPLAVDKERRAVTVYAEVNGKYFTEPTRHGVVFKDGANGGKAVLRAWANQMDFYRALLDLGGQPGNNVTLETKEAVVEGSPLEITVTWAGAGKSYDIAELIKDTAGRGFEPRFGGNEARAREKQTGCIFCLDTCPVGITSNARYPQGSFDGGKVQFYGNKDLLPPDGTPVAVTFRLR